jgi:arsenite-transporting ATPase
MLWRRQLETTEMPTTTFQDRPSRFLFFTGKGGVGKTTLACATAIRLADAGKRILIVSTDPASNLDEMLGVKLSNRPTAVPGVERLHALNIDPEKAAEAYRERVIGPYRGTWTEAQIGQLREQLAGACTVEIAAFDQFVMRPALDTITSCSTRRRPGTRCDCSAFRVPGRPFSSRRPRGSRAWDLTRG